MVFLPPIQATPPAPRRRSRAFSLVELVIVLCIIALVSAMAIPRYAGATARYRLDAAAKRIATDLALSRQQAQVTSHTQSVVFQPSAGTYSIAGLPSLDNPALGYSVNLGLEPYKATLVSANFGGAATAAFDCYGAPVAGGTVVVRVGTSQKSIVLDTSTGKVTIP